MFLKLTYVVVIESITAYVSGCKARAGGYQVAIFFHLSLFRQARTHNFLVIPHINTLVRISRMGPYHGPAKGFVRAIDQMCPAQFLILLRREPRDDEVARFAEEKIAVLISRDEGIAVRFATVAAGRRLKGFPQALAGIKFDSPQVANFAIIPINRVPFDHWSTV